MPERNTDGLTEAEKAETAQMEAAGFEWDPARGYARWTHMKVGVTALRELWMTRDVDWDKHRARKILEASRLRRFDDVALGTRFRYPHDRQRIWVKIGNGGTSGENLVALWAGPDVVSPPRYLSEVVDRYRTVVELFEPFDGLVTPSELEELPKLAGVWSALADWHDYQAAGAEAADSPDSSKWHDEHSAKHHATAAAIQKRWEDG